MKTRLGITVRRGYNALGASHRDQSGVGEGEKRCTKCHEIKPLDDFFKGRGFRNRRSICKPCMYAAKGYRKKVRGRRRVGSPQPSAWDDAYAILYDPTSTFLGLIQCRDFRETLKWGYWPNDMIVRFKGKLYIVKGVKLHEAHHVTARLREN